MSVRAFVLCCLGLAAGCASHAHLGPNHGKSYHEAIARQTANPEAGEKDAVAKGLDTQEAAAISDAYRASLGRKGQGGLQADSGQNKLWLAPLGGEPQR